MHLHTKFQDFLSLGSNIRALTEGQTDGTETITLPAKAGGNHVIRPIQEYFCLRNCAQSITGLLPPALRVR